MTHRLYHDDAYLRRFDAEVVAHITYKARPAIVLDRTAFYPEAGGQLGDRGRLAGLAVVDTQETDDGTIVHLIEAESEPRDATRGGVNGQAPPGQRGRESPLSIEVPAIGARVTGELDWVRRRQHMAQHTAQHLLSGALLDRAQAPTVSARLGETSLTIDVSRDRVPEAELAAAEDLANDIVDDDVEIRAWFPGPDELAGLKLRRDPKVSADIRVVAIGEFDWSPCGGTHCARSSQLAAVRITGSERYKGMTRVTFTTARRGRAELFARDQVLRGLASQFSCGPAEVPAAIDKLRRDAEAAGGQITQLRGRLAAAILAQLPGDGPAIAALPGDAELLRSVAAKLSAAGRDAILCAPDDAGAGAIVVMIRGAGSSLDCGALWKRLAARYGGRGGGKPDRADGRLATAVTDWPAMVADVTG